MTRPLLVVDGDNLAHRAFHALPQSIRDAKGKPANALVGFTNMLLATWAAERPRAVFVGFDTLEVETYRHELLPDYQGGREFAPELTDQLDRLPELVASFGFPSAKEGGYEADDFIAAAVAAEERAGGQALVFSNDRDLFQLSSDHTTILRPRRGTRELERIGPAEVRKIYGVEPAQVPDFIALRGDASDRIPGVYGVGPASAASILKRYGSLEATLEAGSYADQADKLRGYRSIASLRRDAPIPPLPAGEVEPDWKAAAVLMERWGLRPRFPSS
jgi:DNA polymerase-1